MPQMKTDAAHITLRQLSVIHGSLPVTAWPPVELNKYDKMTQKFKEGHGPLSNFCADECSIFINSPVITDELS